MVCDVCSCNGASVKEVVSPSGQDGSSELNYNMVNMRIFIYQYVQFNPMDVMNGDQLASRVL